MYRRRLTGNSDKNLRIVVRSRGFRSIAVADGRSLAWHMYTHRSAKLWS